MTVNASLIVTCLGDVLFPTVGVAAVRLVEGEAGLRGTTIHNVRAPFSMTVKQAESTRMLPSTLVSL